MTENTIGQMFVGTFPQLLASLIGTIGAISDGMQYGWSAPVIPILESSSSPVKNFGVEDEYWIETLYLLGGIGGLPITIYVVDKYGRHTSILVAAVCSLIAWVLVAVADSIEYIFVARFVAGIAGDVAFVAAPMYVAEIADQKIRGFLAGLIYLMMLVGILVIYSLAPYVPFYVPSIVGGTILTIQLIAFPFMPESPYFLLEKNRMEKAEKSLRWLRTTTEIRPELEEITQVVEKQKTEKGRPQDLFLVSSNRRAMTVICVLNAAQHFSGLSVMLMNVHSILEEAGSIYLGANAAGIIFSAIMLVAASTSSFYVDKYGRKILLVSSSILTGISLLVLAIYFNLKNTGTDVESLSWIPIACVMMYAAVFKFGLGMVPIVITAEIFSASVKALGMTLGDTCYIIFGLLSIEIYQRLADLCGLQVPFYIFASMAFLNAIFSYFYVPETKGKTLDEIQDKLKRKRGEKASDNNNLPGDTKV